MGWEHSEQEIQHTPRQTMLINDAKELDQDDIVHIPQMESTTVVQEDLQQAATPEMVELMEVAMAHAQRNAELEVMIEQMRQTEQEHLEEIAMLQQEKEQGDFAENANKVAVLEELAMKHMQQNAELENFISDMKKQEKEYLTLIVELQNEAGNNNAPVATSTANLDEVPTVKSQEEQLVAASQDATIQELREATMAQSKRNDDLEGLVGEMQMMEQNYLSQIEQLKEVAADRDAQNEQLKEVAVGRDAQIEHLMETAAGRDEMANMATIHAQRATQLETQLSDMKRVERDLRMRIAELETMLTQDSAKASTKVQESDAIVSAHANRIVELEAMVHATKQAERDHETRMAQLQATAITAEAEAAARARCNSELFAELGEMRHAQQERDLRIVKLEEEAAGVHSTYTARIQELETRASVQEQRNAELEAVMHSLHEREARIQHFEETFTTQMNTINEGAAISANELANAVMENATLKKHLAEAQDQINQTGQTNIIEHDISARSIRPARFTTSVVPPVFPESTNVPTVSLAPGHTSPLLPFGTSIEPRVSYGNTMGSCSISSATNIVAPCGGSIDTVPAHGTAKFPFNYGGSVATFAGPTNCKTAHPGSREAWPGSANNLGGSIEVKVEKVGHTVPPGAPSNFGRNMRHPSPVRVTTSVRGSSPIRPVNVQNMSPTHKQPQHVPMRSQPHLNAAATAGHCSSLFGASVMPQCKTSLSIR